MYFQYKWINNVFNRSIVSMPPHCILTSCHPRPFFPDMKSGSACEEYRYNISDSLLDASWTLGFQCMEDQNHNSLYPLDQFRCILDLAWYYRLYLLGSHGTLRIGLLHLVELLCAPVNQNYVLSVMFVNKIVITTSWSQFTIFAQLHVCFLASNNKLDGHVNNFDSPKLHT